jgi:dTDP-4-amino-4,6-dideoxygalactose transaminase
MNITLGHLDISARGKQYVNDCLDNNRLSKGKYTARFEKEFAAVHQSKYGVFCNSGTSALQIALATLKERYGYEDGDEVLVPAITFIATSNVVLQNNLKPVFVDVDPHTFNMNPDAIAGKLTSRTRAIIPVHLFGLPANMSRIMHIARTRGLQVIEDSCETMFASVDGWSVGGFGDMACFSTYVAHLIVGGVGGLVTTNDSKNAEMCRSLLAHGRDNIYLSIDDDDAVDDAELSRIIKRRYSFDRIGYSYRCTEIEAAIALSEFERWEENLSTRRRNAARLTELLKPLEDKLQLPYIPNGHSHSFMMFPLVLRSGNREPLLMHLEKRGIETRYMFPLLSQPVYRRLFPNLAGQYPIAQRLESQGFFIGCHQGIDDAGVQYVADSITDYFGGRR